MNPEPHNHVSDLRGVSRLAIAATSGLTGLVEALHERIAERPSRLGGPVIGGTVNGITSLVYRGIRGVMRVVGGGVDLVLAQLAPLLGEIESSPTRDALVAALNGVLGDYLAETHNPLSITMHVRSAGEPLELTREGLAALRPAGRIVLLVHGLCMNDLQWARNEHDHGAALARDLGLAPVYLRYNSGLHVSTNGRALADLLEQLVTSWPVQVEELVIIGHSMGGLVARSACHYGQDAGHAWTAWLQAMIFLGTPHHGAPLERGGHWIDQLLGSTPYTKPFTRLGRIRSAGITDLRHGSLLDEDWEGRDRFAHGRDLRTPVPLPASVRCFAIAGTTGNPTDELSRVPGDGLVPVASALGHHEDPQRELAFPPEHQWISAETSHLDLLGSQQVYVRIRDWLSVATPA
jgi:pimeloyl-ACP methyl ester carboxylesterase